MRPGPSPKGLLMKRKILSASAKVFLEKGYAKASSKMVAELLGVSNGSPFFHYGNKEGVLLELVRQMFAGQFRSAERLIGPDADPLLLYAAETAMQMHLAELSEPLRELYVTAYTLPSTSRFIYESMLPKLAAIFGGFLSDTSEQNLRGLELASAGVTRSFMAEPCSEQFPMERKLRQYLTCCFKLYDVPPERYEPVIRQTIQMELTPIAEQIIDRTVRQADEAFEAAMATAAAQCP